MSDSSADNNSIKKLVVSSVFDEWEAKSDILTPNSKRETRTKVDMCVE